MKNLLLGRSANEYINDATSTQKCSKLLDLQQYTAKGQPVTLEMTVTALCGAFIDINGGHGEDMYSLFNSLLSTYGEGTCHDYAARTPPCRLKWVLFSGTTRFADKGRDEENHSRPDQSNFPVQGASREAQDSSQSSLL